MIDKVSITLSHKGKKSVMTVADFLLLIEPTSYDSSNTPLLPWYKRFFMSNESLTDFFHKAHTKGYLAGAWNQHFVTGRKLTNWRK